jgi:hypothetical protein
MKKMSLLSVFLEAKKRNKDLEDWSASLEERPVDVAMQRGATKAMPTDVQSVWGGPTLEDDLPEPGSRSDSDSMLEQPSAISPQQFAQRYNLSPQDIQDIQNLNFDNVLGRVGEIENFGMDAVTALGLDPESVNDAVEASTQKINPRVQPTKLSAGSLTLSNALQNAEMQVKGKSLTNPGRASVSMPSNRNVPMAHDQTMHAFPPPPASPTEKTVAQAPPSSQQSVSLQQPPQATQAPRSNVNLNDLHMAPAQPPAPQLNRSDEKNPGRKPRKK